MVFQIDRSLKGYTFCRRLWHLLSFLTCDLRQHLQACFPRQIMVQMPFTAVPLAVLNPLRWGTI